MKEDFFALGLSEHRLWGTLFLPFTLSRAPNDKYYTTTHTITASKDDTFYDSLPEHSKQIISIIEEYNEQAIFRLFSKNKNLKEFHEKVTRETIDTFIRPYIEKRLAIIFKITKSAGVNIFIRDKTRTSVFDEDFLQVIQENAEPVFNFNRSPEASSYSLELKMNGSKITLKNQFVDTISNFPALIRLNKSIVSVRDIEAKKIKPFLVKDFISIPSQAELKYFKSFVLNIVRRFEVNASGFNINNLVPEIQAYISLEKDLQSIFVLVLRFRYGKRKILANSSTKVFVDFHHEKGVYQYDKYPRDAAFEEIYHNFLKSRGLISFDDANYRTKVLSPDAEVQDLGIIEWINQYSNEIQQSGLILEHNLGEIQYFTGQLIFNLSTHLEGDWFDIKAEVIAGDFKIPFYKFRKNILNGIREYLLPDNKVLILPLEWFTRYRELFEFAKTEKHSIRVHKQHFNVVAGFSAFFRTDQIRDLEKLSHRETLIQASLPEKLNAILRPYQLEGFTWLLHLQQNNLGGCLADDMGLGKTLQAISVLLKSKETTPGERNAESSDAQLSLFTENTTKKTSLVVVPASLVHNWVNEIRKFAPSLKVYPYFGIQRLKKPSHFDRYDLILSSYHTVRQDIDLLSGYGFHYIILDESQVIKNPGSKVYMAVEQLRGEHRLALTGTPIENSLTDLWAQMNFINPGLLGNLSFFKKEYVYPIEKKGEKNKEDRLKKLIDPFILRRTKSEVAPELPDVVDQVIYCSMTEEQRIFYEKEKSGIRNYIFESIEKEGIEKSSIVVLQGLTRLRQIANHPVLVDNDFGYESGKFEEIMRNAESVIAEGHKALLFSSFVKHLNLFEKEFKKRKIRYELLTGESTKRENIIKAFQEHADCKLFLISLKAGGVGLNLTAADYVFLLDPWWNPASENQAVSRSHRIGQKNNVFVYRFISEDSIEEKIQNLQEKKSKLADAFVTSNNPMKEISREELEELLN